MSARKDVSAGLYAEVGQVRIQGMPSHGSLQKSGIKPGTPHQYQRVSLSPDAGMSGLVYRQRKSPIRHRAGFNEEGMKCQY